MKCLKCAYELPEHAQRCPSCGETVTELSVTQPIQGGALLELKVKVPEWTPKKRLVEKWASGELDHYEVLELEMDAPDEEVKRRMGVLEERLEEWQRHQDANLQRLAAEGIRRLYEMKEALKDRESRESYNRELEERKHQKVVEEVRGRVEEYVKDGVLQWYEWMALREWALSMGVSEEELERILQEQEEKGVLTGITVAGQRVRTLEKLKEVCDGKVSELVEVIWNEVIRNGKIERWLEKAIDRKDLADEVKRVRDRYEENRPLGAQVFLWALGERGLVLNGQKVESVGQWVGGVYDGGLEEASVEALRDGRLEEWLRGVMSQEELAAIAAQERSNERKGLWRLIWQTGKRAPSSEAAYRATRKLVQKEPDFWEGHYQHARHCRAVGQLREMWQHLRQAIEGDRSYLEKAEVDPEFEQVRDELRKFLQQIKCDLWMVEVVRPALNREVLTGEERARILREAEQRGIDLSTAQEIIRKIVPELEIDPADLVFGVLKRGARQSLFMRVSNIGGGQLQGVIKTGSGWVRVMPDRLDPAKREQIVEVHVDTSGLRSGLHSAMLIFETSGGVRSVPVNVTVKPPRSLALLTALGVGSLIALAVPFIREQTSNFNNPPRVEELQVDKLVVRPGEQVMLIARATDPDGDELMFEWQPSAGQIMGTGPSVTLDTSGLNPVSTPSITVKLMVRDKEGESDSRSIDIKLMRPDGPFPRVRLDAPQQARPGDDVTLTARVGGAENHRLSYQWTSSEGQISGSGRTVTLRIPTTITSNVIQVSVTVSDERGVLITADRTISILLKERGENGQPVIQRVDAQPLVVHRGDAVHVSVSATDPDRDPLIYRCTASEGSILGHGPTFTLDTSSVDTSAGPRRVRITATVSDGQVWSPPREVWITVTPRSNRPPVISSISPSNGTTVPRGQTVHLSAHATDPDDDPLTCMWFLEGSPIGSTCAINFETSRVDVSAGAHPVRFDLIVDDGRGGRALGSVTIIVEPPPATRFSVLHFHDHSNPANSCRGYLEISGGRVRYITTGGVTRHDFPWTSVQGCGLSGFRVGSFGVFYINLRGGQGGNFGHDDGYGNPRPPGRVIQALGCNN
ncbi:MAG: hypothetical protein QXS54_00915 [Candidatus Methanomethylicaceae archaeon]